MKIISPTDNLAECRSLLDAGADELYGGYVPPEWSEQFSLLTSINQRTFDAAQIASRDELRAIVDQVHAAGGTFSLTLNSPFYTDQQLPMLVDYVADVVALGVDGIILADLSLLRSLREPFPELEMHASTLAHVGNSRAVSVYADAGIDRLIFPRHIPVSEIKEIIDMSPGVTFDAFLLVGKCPNTEGLCTFHHSSGDRIWPCEIPYTIEPADGAASDTLESAMLQQASWSQSNRRHGCGLCAIPHLVAAGVSGLKLVGRGAPSAQKVRNVLLAKEFVGLAGSEPDFERYRIQAMAAHEERFGSPCSPNICYFPEFYVAE